mgnify:CR=1 FL=1|jgi:nitroreductase|tara:strand:+ start:374 stop:961 length:588 start_codon:yes stop_codon:yes gene_type:complete
MKYNLSEVNDVIRDRRTIYPEFFSDRKIHREQIELLLENARWAPSHKLTQPWYYKVFMGDGLVKFAEFHAEKYKEITPKDKFKEVKYNKIKNRPLKSSAVVVACMKRDKEERVPEIEELASCYSGIQNILLSATAYGFGVYWGTGGLTYSDHMKKFIGLNNNDKVLGLLMLGYTDNEWPRKTPRKPLEYYTDWVE